MIFFVLVGLDNQIRFQLSRRIGLKSHDGPREVVQYRLDQLFRTEIDDETETYTTSDRQRKRSWIDMNDHPLEGPG